MGTDHLQKERDQLRDHLQSRKENQSNQILSQIRLHTVFRHLCNCEWLMVQQDSLQSHHIIEFKLGK